MKREDIIRQKLFETCTLSEFYLNLVVNAKLTNEEESPLQLASQFTQKLYEIVERYDRLLETNKQKEQFSLSFDQISRSSTNIIKHKPPLTPTISLSGRCSTPNTNKFTSSNHHLHSASSTPSTEVPPSTQNYLNSFFRKSNSNLSLNKSSTWNISNSNLNNLTRKQSHKHYYTRQLAYNNKTRNSSSKNSHSNNPELSNINKNIKLCQRIASVYYGSDSEDDETDNSQFKNLNNDTNDEIELNYHYRDLTTNKFTDQDILKYINETSPSNLLLKKDNDLLTTSTSASSTSSSSNNYDCSMNSDNNSTLSANCYNESTLNTTPNRSNNIGKSFSNLSKDSGVFMGESYHSEYSNSKSNLTVRTRLFKNGNEDMEDENEDEDEQALNSPISSQELNETVDNEEIYDFNLEESSSSSSPLPNTKNMTVAAKIKNEFKPDKSSMNAANQFIWNLQINNQTKNNDLENSSNDEISTSSSQETINDNESTQVVIPNLREHYFKNKVVDSRTIKKSVIPEMRSKLIQSEFTTKIKYFSQFNKTNKLSIDEQQNYDLKGIEPGLMSMMIDSNNNGHFNINSPNNNYSASFDDLSPKNQTSSSKNNNNQQSSEDSGLFFNNNSSLMNVSMLDNIQATNTNNLDFMSSSILTFE